MLGPRPRRGPALETKTALKENVVFVRISTVARLLGSTTGRRRSVPLTRGGLIGVGQPTRLRNNFIRRKEADHRQYQNGADRNRNVPPHEIHQEQLDCAARYVDAVQHPRVHDHSRRVVDQ